jgi:hypothetical protein
MDRDCRCGREMELELRSVIWKRVVEMRHVPVFHCHECGRDELLSSVQPIVKTIVEQSSEPIPEQKRTIDLAQHSEFTDVLLEMAQSEIEADRLPEVIEERVNRLLDLFNVAIKSGDAEWTQSIKDRLNQLSKPANPSSSTYSA